MKRVHSQYGYWYMGKPMYEEHEDLQQVHRDVCARVFPSKTISDIKEMCSTWHNVMSNFRKQDAFRHFHVSQHLNDIYKTSTYLLIVF